MNKLKTKMCRPIEVWEKCDPYEMVALSPTATRFTFADMRHDLLLLHETVKALTYCLDEIVDSWSNGESIRENQRALNIARNLLDNI